MKNFLVLAIALATLPVMAADKPVTVGEFSTTAVKVESILRRAIHLPQVVVTAKKGSAPVTRAQIIGEMDRLFTLAWPKFKLTPVLAPVNLKRFGLTDPKARLQAIRLIQFGSLAPFGPLVTGKEKGVSPREFGDAFGFFLSRIAELTHTPSNEFTPALMDD
jgi:hypothetical protein